LIVFDDKKKEAGGWLVLNIQALRPLPEEPEPLYFLRKEIHHGPNNWPNDRRLYHRPDAFFYYKKRRKERIDDCHYFLFPQHPFHAVPYIYAYGIRHFKVTKYGTYLT